MLQNLCLFSLFSCCLVSLREALLGPLRAGCLALSLSLWLSVSLSPYLSFSNPPPPLPGCPMLVFLWCFCAGSVADQAAGQGADGALSLQCTALQREVVMCC